MGYNYCDTLTPRQALLNVFTKWCKLTSLKICPRKCNIFAMRKCGTRPVQFNPYLRVNNEQIPTIKLDEEFTYLSKTF